MKHKTKGFIAMILALCLMMSLGIGALATGEDQDKEVVSTNQAPDAGIDLQDDPQYGPKTYTVTVSTGTSATLEAFEYNTWKGDGWKTISGNSVPAGASVRVKVKLSDGYELDGTGFTVTNGSGTSLANMWEVKGDNEIWVTVKDNVTIAVNTKAKTFNIENKTATDANGSITVASSAAFGSTVTVTPQPKDGFELDTLTVKDASGSGVPVTNNTFTMPASDVTVTATFKQVETPEPEKHFVDSAVFNGTIEYVKGSDADAACGETVRFKINPNSGCYVSTVTVGSDTLTPDAQGIYSFTMPNHDVTIEAVCTHWWPDWDNMYNVDTWSNSVDGGISCDADMALAGSEVTFRVWHNYKYDYYDYDVYVLNDRTGNRVSLDYSAYDDEYSFTMPDDDVTIYVYFDYVGTYSITKDVEGDGSIYVRSSADYRDTVWIEASPNAGQSLTSLRVFYGEPWAYGDKGYYGYWDEADVHYSEYWDAYYFTMPAADVVVYARFTDGATVDVIAGDHGDAKVSSRYAEKGDWVYITAYPDEGYEVDSVTVTDSLGRSVKVTELSYDYFLFTMPGTSVDVKVTFRAKDYDVFYDVNRGDWYYKAVRFVHEKGIMEGTGTHYFSPEADLSRGMLATILYRLEGSPAVSGYSGFSDVADTAYYAKAVAWAKANGIVNGVTATAYEPDTAVTREELAAILCRYAAFKGKDTAISYDYLAGFSDANTSHVYARPALNWAVAYDIINGQGNGVLAPRATATRAEVAQVLMNYLEVFD